jgi:hypothetical protein
MDKRDPCLNFLKGNCDLKGKCTFGHYIIPNTEEFIKEYESKIKSAKENKLESSSGIFSQNNQINSYLFSGDRIYFPQTVMAACDLCKKKFSYSQGERDIKTRRCMDCIIDPLRS